MPPVTSVVARLLIRAPSEVRRLNATRIQRACECALTRMRRLSGKW